jgi:RNA polymerase sigma factor (sigma-70 family)
MMGIAPGWADRETGRRPSMTDDDVREMTDEEFRELLTLFREGDEAACRRMFLYLESKLRPMVSPTLRLQYTRVGEKADSGDVLHDVLCRMIPYLRDPGGESFDGVAHFHRLTARVLRNTLIDLKRKHFGSLRAHPLADGANDFDSRLGESSGLDGWRTRLSVHELVDKLEPEDRNVIELALYSNLKNADLARCLDVSQGHASRLLLRAKERLGLLIQEEKQKSG